MLNCPASGPSGGSAGGSAAAHAGMLVQNRYLCALLSYFCCAWVINFAAARSTRKFTLNSIDSGAAWKSSGKLLVVALIELGFIFHAAPGSGAAVAYAWLFGALIPAKLCAEGVLLHLFVPYAQSPLVLEQGPTWQARAVDFHPWAWVCGALVNVGGVAVHIALVNDALAAAPCELCSDHWGRPDAVAGACDQFPAVLGLLAALTALLGFRTAKAQRGAWASRDAAWYPQFPVAHEHTLVSPSVPTMSTYITMTDGCRLAADVWLPDDNQEPEAPLPCICVSAAAPFASSSGS